MKTGFFITAAIMVAVALIALLLPLLRHGRSSGRPRSMFALALFIAFVLPVTTGALYLLIGTPVALNPQADVQQPLTLQDALGQLRTHLAQQPDDARGWMLLAQTSSMQHDAASARDAYDHVLKLTPNNTEAMVGWAENDSMTRAGHQIEGRALELLKHAVQLQPDSQRGLWLLGIGEFQQKHYRDAAGTWRVLQPQLEPGSNVAQAVAQQIAKADALAGGPAAATSSASAPLASASGAKLQVQVKLSPALKGKIAAGDTLFVYARSPDGPPMPLAVARLDANQLPSTVTLTDAMAMMPTMKLSSVAHVFVGARISHSGQPIAQPGDLEGDAGVVATDQKNPISVTIDKVH